jgi:hypothetical protein
VSVIPVVAEYGGILFAAAGFVYEPGDDDVTPLKAGL